MDSGGTLAIELEDAAGGTTFVLIPSDQALDFGTQVMVAAAKAAKLSRSRPG